MAVLIKGKSIKCTQKSRDHYLRGPENERITVREVRGFATKDAEEALRMLELLAKGSKCTKPVYSAKINPETDRLWNKDEIRAAVDLLEENLGLSGHSRVVVEHKKNGRVHFHVLWSRFNPDTGAAARMSNDYAVHQKTQRQLEKSFKLRPMTTKGRDFKVSEVEWAKRYGCDIFAVRDQITTDFNSAKSGQEFKTKLDAQGIVLCRGDKSQFVIILPWAQHKALSSMIHGRPTKAVLRRALGDIDISKLPTVAEGKALVKATLPKAKPRIGFRSKSLGAGYIRSKSFQIAATRATGQGITSRQPKLSSPIYAPMASPLTVMGTSPVAAESKTVIPRETPAQGKGVNEQKITASSEDAGGDESSSGRAEVAYKEEFDKWKGLIDAAASAPGLSKEQRHAAIVGLRQQQKAAANGARQRIIDEEKSACRTRRMLRGLPGSPSRE